jgi:isoquinoline 1-oxidoreductase beta subunit
MAAEKSGWGKPAQHGAARGIASHIFHDTLVSMVAEVSVTGEGDLTIHRIIAAVDCGVVINPKIIRAQMESGIAFGLTATLKSKITFSKGKADQQNFDTFELLRMEEMPVIETVIVESDEAPTGIGEVGVPIIGPVITNAIFAATGKRIRKIPFSRNDLST